MEKHVEISKYKLKLIFKLALFLDKSIFTLVKEYMFFLPGFMDY